LLVQANRSVTEAARRRQIVAATIEVLAEVGQGATTFTRIARRAGLSSTGLISYHFADKADLLDEVLAEVVRAAVAFMGPRIEAAEGHVGKLSARIAANVELVAEHPAHVRALREVLAAPGRSAPADDATAGLTDRVGALAALLRDGQAHGAFGPFDPELMALAVTGAIDAVVAVPPAGEEQVRRAAHELAATFVRATAPHAPGSRP
jgi:AcrR family transcriptional regulator